MDNLTLGPELSTTSGDSPMYTLQSGLVVPDSRDCGEDQRTALAQIQWSISMSSCNCFYCHHFLECSIHLIYIGSENMELDE
jgi:hypothetical protein